MKGILDVWAGGKVETDFRCGVKVGRYVATDVTHFRCGGAEGGRFLNGIPDVGSRLFKGIPDVCGGGQVV